jgi:hypothetical protein
MLQTLGHVARIAGGLGLFVAAGTYLIHRNQFNFNMIVSCNQRFQEVLVDLEEEDKRKKHQAKKRYVDLCNEQLFYFRSGYLPREVIEEWLESMIDYLPLFDDATGEVHPDHLGIVESELLKDYPTIRRVFAVDASYDLTSRDQRMAFVQQVGQRVKPEPILLVLWRDILDRVSDANRGKRVEIPPNNKD